MPLTRPKNILTANLSGTVPVANAPTGSIVQVKHLRFTDTSLTISAPSATDISGFSLSITPTSASNDILIVLHCSCHLNCDGRIGIKRNGTAVTEYIIGTSRVDGQDDIGTFSGTYRDSPNSTSAVTYQVIARATGCTSGVYINKSISGSTDNGRSGLLLMEVKG